MSHQIICAELIGTSGVGTNIVSTTDIHSAVSYLGHNYEKKAAMSLDGLFVPFSTSYDDEYLLHFETPSGDIPRASNLNGIHTNNIQILTPASGLPDNLYRSNIPTSGYKGIGLRAPLVLCGFGYDINNTNEVFFNKCGPVDLRWDDERKVWGFAGGQTSSVDLAKIVINTNIPANSDGIGTLYDTGDQIQIVNFLSQPMISGANAIGWKIYNSGYIIIQHQFYTNSLLTDIVCNSGDLTKTTGTIYTQS